MAVPYTLVHPGATRPRMDPMGAARRAAMFVLVACRAAESPPLGEGGDREAALVDALESAGFLVQEGHVGLLPMEGCCVGDDTCLRWNPTNNYTVWFLPLGPGESADGRELNDQGVAWSWRLRADEAVLFVGPTPDPTRYFSYRSYVADVFTPTPTASGSNRLPALTSLGDSLNMHVVGVEGPSVFSATTLVLTTGHIGVDALVRGAAAASGFEASAVNTDVLPGSLVNFGLEDEADRLRMNLRVALFEDPADLDAWVAQPPGRVFRLTPNTPLAPAPFADPTFRAPVDGVSEGRFLDSVEALRTAILGAHPGEVAVEATGAERTPDPDEPCWAGCVRDKWAAATPTFTLPDDVAVVIYGVNHHLTGKSAYHSAILFGELELDPGAVVTDREFEGSAAAFIPDDPNVGALYAWTFARDCQGNPYCTPVAECCPGVGMEEGASVHWRAYLDPASATHPYAPDLVADRAIRFSPGD